MLVAGCRTVLPWANEPIRDEVNLAFTMENNLLFLDTVTIDDRPGRYLFASAAPRSFIDPRHLPAGTRSLQISERDTLRFSPTALDLGGVSDALIGADVWGDKAVSVDYRQGMVIYQKRGIFPAYMELYRYQQEPAVMVNVNGRSFPAIVDTTSPDTLVLPRAGPDTRGMANVSVGGTNFGAIDVRYDDVSGARIGNRLLSKFLVTIDYGKRTVGLWRDARLP
ncbi:MAG TPA: hypothetical protein VF618_28655 [Thermoanaerobaculia bacterium]